MRTELVPIDRTTTATFNRRDYCHTSNRDKKKRESDAISADRIRPSRRAIPHSAKPVSEIRHG
jgi:hypothetical protein